MDSIRSPAPTTTQDRRFAPQCPHDLRHTAASLAISAGADVKAVRRRLGHTSAAMTLYTYAGFFDDDLDYVADALSRARLVAPVYVLGESENREIGLE